MAIDLVPVEAETVPAETTPETAELPEAAEVPEAAEAEATEATEPEAAEATEPAEATEAAPTAPTKRGRPRKKPEPATPVVMKTRAKPSGADIKSKAAPEPPDPDEHLSPGDLETAILEFLVNRRQSQHDRRRQLWSQLAGL